MSDKAENFHDILKIGRTHLQDATPIRLGQVFSGYARQVELAQERLAASSSGLYELALGGTAVGTGINTHPQFAAITISAIARETCLPFREAGNHFEAQGAKDAGAKWTQLVAAQWALESGFGKHAPGQNYILGVRGKGYNFEAPATRVARFDPQNAN